MHRRSLVKGAFAASAASFGSTFMLGASAQTSTIKISTTVARPNESYPLLDHLAQRVPQLTSSQAKVEILPPFGTERDMFESVLLGQTQIQSSSVEAFGQWVPEARVMSLPFFYRSAEEAVAVAKGPAGQSIKSKAEAKGFMVLGMIPMGVRALISKTPVEKLADLKGKRIRVINSPIWISLYQGFGAIPVPMDWSDVYPSLQKGVIDAVDAGLGGSLAAKHNEVAKFGIATDHAFQFQVVAASLRWWRSLPEPQRAAISKAMDEGMAVQFAEFKKGAAAEADNWTKAGGNVHRPSEGFLREVLQSAKASSGEYGKVVGGDEIISLARKSMAS